MNNFQNAQDLDNLLKTQVESEEDSDNAEEAK